MSSPQTACDPVRACPWLVNSLLQWLTLGVLLVLFVPAARGASVWFGALPFWLLVAPLSALLVLYRAPLQAAWRRGHDFRPTG